MQGWMWKDVTLGEEGELKLQRDRMIASAIYLWLGWAHPLSLSQPHLTPKMEFAHEGHRFGETQILPWPNRCHCFSCTFLYLFPRGIYQPLLFPKLGPSRNFCCILLSPKASWCKCRKPWMEDLCYNTHSCFARAFHFCEPLCPHLSNGDNVVVSSSQDRLRGGSMGRKMCLNIPGKHNCHASMGSLFS